MRLRSRTLNVCSVLLALLMGLATPAHAAVESVGLVAGGGVDFFQITPGVVAELLPVELRLSPAAPPGRLRPARYDLLLDWEQLAMTSIFTSQPRVGVACLAVWGAPVAGRWAAALGAGLDAEWGRDARVIHEELRWVPAGSSGVTARLGLERQSDRRFGLGLYGRGVAGFRAGSEGPEAWRQAMGELSLTWRLGPRED